MSAPERLRRIDGLPFQEISGQVIVVVPKSREVHLLNETATRVWELLEKESTLEDLLKVIVEEYEVEPAQARADLESVLAEMKAKGVIEAVGDRDKSQIQNPKS